MVRLAIAFFFFLAVGPTVAFGDEGDLLHVHPLSVIPFAVLLLCIAILPLVAGHFWHSNLKKLYVAIGISIPVLAYLAYLGEPGLHRLTESLVEYIQFIVLLGSLYTVSGGIVLEGDLKPSAKVNLGFLLVGALIANFIGTTGASMLLIPSLSENQRPAFLEGPSARLLHFHRQQFGRVADALATHPCFSASFAASVFSGR